MKKLVKKQVGVIGAGTCGCNTRALAETVGREIAKKGAVLLCGGLGGVMEAAAFGAKQEGGMTLGKNNTGKDNTRKNNTGKNNGKSEKT